MVTKGKVVFVVTKYIAVFVVTKYIAVCVVTRDRVIFLWGMPTGRAVNVSLQFSDNLSCSVGRSQDFTASFAKDASV